MKNDDFHQIPKVCPITGEPLYVSELTSQTTGVIIKGKFQIPQQDELSDDQREFLTVFIRARGVISTIEKELGISYPTVRNKIDLLLDAMGLEPIKHDRRVDNKSELKAKILKQLEEGEITAAEAKDQLKKVGAQ